VVDPTGPASGSNRVVRGGSWFSLGGDCRSAIRYICNPDYGFNVLGFRVVLAPGQP
jgi:sulfatase modifying factor 1